MSLKLSDTPFNNAYKKAQEGSGELLVNLMGTYYMLKISVGKAKRIQFVHPTCLDDPLKVTGRYYIYLVNDSEEFKKGKAIYFDSMDKSWFEYSKIVREETYTYIEYGIEVEGLFSYTIQSKNKESEVR